MWEGEVPGWGWGNRAQLFVHSPSKYLYRVIFLRTTYLIWGRIRPRVWKAPWFLAGDSLWQCHMIRGKTEVVGAQWKGKERTGTHWRQWAQCLFVFLPNIYHSFRQRVHIASLKWNQDMNTWISRIFSKEGALGSHTLQVCRNEAFFNHGNQNCKPTFLANPTSLILSVVSFAEHSSTLMLLALTLKHWELYHFYLLLYVSSPHIH